MSVVWTSDSVLRLHSPSQDGGSLDHCPSAWHTLVLWPTNECPVLHVKCTVEPYAVPLRVMAPLVGISGKLQSTTGQDGRESHFAAYVIIPAHTCREVQKHYMHST